MTIEDILDSLDYISPIKPYKVTQVVEKKTKNGDLVYSITLNNTIHIHNVNPALDWSSGKRNLGLIQEIRQIWINNNNKLDVLIGKYIAASIKDSNYGVQFDEVSSLDLIADFKNLLEANKEELFSTCIPIYDFLEAAHYNKNEDGSISLKAPYHNIKIKKHRNTTICYPHIVSNYILTMDNLKAIYKKFYADSYYSSMDEDGDFKHALNYAEGQITVSYHHVKVSYKATTSGDKDYWTSTIALKLGDSLSEEQIEYLVSLEKGN